MPLLYGGQAIGTLSVYTGQPYSFSNEEIRILSALAELSAIAIEKARLYERVVDVEEQLRQNEKLSALGLLAAEVAHEIRNPLTVLKMLYHSLDLKFPAGDPRAKDARIIDEKIGQLNTDRGADPRFCPHDGAAVGAGEPEPADRRAGPAGPAQAEAPEHPVDAKTWSRTCRR